MRNVNLNQFVKLRRQLTEERGTLEARLRELNEALSDMPMSSVSENDGGAGQETAVARPGRRGGHGMSAAGRARIAAAQRARWAKLQGGNATSAKAANGSVQKPKRRMSAAGRKAIAEAARKRWAAARAAGKTRL